MLGVSSGNTPSYLPTEKGLNLIWQSVSPKPEGRLKDSAYLPIQKYFCGVYDSAGKAGGRVGLKNLRGVQEE